MIKDLYQKYKIYGWKRFISYAISETWHELYTQPIMASYSQKGEDLIIDKILGFKKDGFYVDVGAYDPHRFSNTKRFYLRGWSGINIEPNPKNYEKFLRDRERDISLNLGIANEQTVLSFYELFPDALSTFSEQEKEKYIKMGHKLVKIHQVPVMRLSTVFRKYAENKKIDFLSIDTEGYELEVLKSNDWLKFRPKVICIESVEYGISSSGKSNKQDDLLNSVGYKEYYDNGLNSIYIDVKNAKNI